MKRLEELLPSKEFMRTHKSFIVRLGVVKAIFGNMVELSNGAKVPIGLQYRTLLRSQFNNIN
jgi:DNA-binding LytR/AlgR family response regulator